MANAYQVDPTGGRRVISLSDNKEHIRRLSLLATVLKVTPLEVVIRAVKLLADSLNTPEPPTP